MTRAVEFDKMARRALGEIDKDFGYWPGYRAAQAKGTLCTGTFASARGASLLTRAAHFAPDAKTDVIVRFANSATNPTRPDGALDVRAMSCTFQLQGQRRTDITALRMPRFLVGSAQQFLLFQRAISRNPFGDLPLPNWRALWYALTGRLPLDLPRRQLESLCRVPSYATCRYNSLHAFRWVDETGGRRYVRYSWIPEEGERTLRWWNVRGWDRDHLQHELRARLERGPVQFRLMVEIAQDDDAVDDASALWGAGRQQELVGRLELTGLYKDDESLSFDPTRVTDGIEVTEGDELLRLRQVVYRLSYERRTSARGQEDADGQPGTPAAAAPPKSEHNVTLENGVVIAYETSGDPADRPLLLIMGFGCPLTWWHPKFIDALVQRGFFVICFDNRDSGRSTRVGRAPNRLLGLLFPKRFAPYTVDDMGNDAAGLLKALGVGAAHIMGVSLGGMIGQSLAIHHSKQVLSLTCLSSAAAWPRWPPSRWPALLVIARLMKGTKRATDAERYVESRLPLWRLLNRGFPFEEAHVTALLRETWKYTGGAIDSDADFRQVLAVLAGADRTPELRELNLPAAVLHGTEDPLVRFALGLETKVAIPRSKLIAITGMGHYTPTEKWDTVVDVVERTAGHARVQ